MKSDRSGTNISIDMNARVTCKVEAANDELCLDSIGLFTDSTSFSPPSPSSSSENSGSSRKTKMATIAARLHTIKMRPTEFKGVRDQLPKSTLIQLTKIFTPGPMAIPRMRIMLNMELTDVCSSRGVPLAT